MKRARIKAMVSVPARRKAAPDASVSENTTITIQHNSESKKTTPDATCGMLEKEPEHNPQEKGTKEDVEIKEGSQTEDAHMNQESNECEVKPVQSSEDFKKSTAQLPETVNKVLPVSPAKLTQNRSSFVKPTPKFDGGGRIRRNSTQGSGASASESEDDNRKVTNSASANNAHQSSRNMKDVTVNTNSTKNNVTTTNVGQKRRILISESARKLAEARREFHLKNENKTPDRSKLTMYDLIYYNPVTNPMKKSRESGLATKKLLDCPPEEIQEEEAEDDPSSAMPVPQVKVGPNGQLIIDEQSLVIEQTNAKKGREVLSREVIIDDDNGNGFYKRRKKSKDWSKWETLKFYKTLNTVGTDFLLMQSFFPNRTRQEIKLKFKKEEKVNRNLVEKALAYHQEFNIETLEKSMAQFENLEKVNLNTEKKQKRVPKEKKKKTLRQRRKSRIVAATIEEMDESDEEEGRDLSKTVDENIGINNDSEQTLSSSVANKKADKRPREEEQLSISETDESVSLNSWNDCDSDTEVYRVRPTRSGRIPKIKRLQGPDINTLDNETRTDDPDNEDNENHKEIIVPSEERGGNTPGTIVFNDSNIETQHPASLKSVIPNIGKVEPGSLVILSKESLEEPGESVLQVYMVSSDVNSQNVGAANMTPVNISSELLATVTAKLPDVNSVTAKEECE